MSALLKFRRILLATLCVGMSLKAGAATHWTTKDFGYPDGYPTTIETFSNAIYAGISSPDSLTRTTVKKSIDGVTWTTVVVAQQAGNPTMLKAFGGFLYAFIDDSSTPPNNDRRVYRTSDGNQWTRMDSSEFPLTVGGLTDSWRDVFSFNDSLYAVGYRGDLWRFDETATPHWTSVSINIPGNPLESPRFRAYKSDLYLMTAQTISTAPLVQRFGVWKSPDLVNWTKIIATDQNLQNTSFRAGYMNLAESNGWLYWSSVGGSMITDGTSAFSFSIVPSGGNALPIPQLATLNNRLYAFSPTALPCAQTTPPTTVNGSQSWAVADLNLPDANRFQASPGSYITFKDLSIVVSGRLLILKEGIISATTNGPLNAKLNPGEANQPVLDFSVEVNDQERARNLRFRNLGSAQNRTDIASATLFLYDSRLLQPLAKLTDLVPSEDGIYWSTPTGYVLDVRDGDRYIVCITASKHPRTSATCQFALTQDDVTWDVSQTLDLGVSVRNTQSQTFSSTDSTADGLLIYPQPAKDTVRFMYDMDNAGTIDIRIIDEIGQLTKELSEDKAAGLQQFSEWDARGVTPGVYYALIKITTTSGTQTFKKKVFIER